MNRCFLNSPWLALLLPLAFACQFAAGNEVRGSSTTFFVDQTATEGKNDGSSWEDAFLDLTEALSTADPGDQIWVAAGLYTPPNAQSSFNLGDGIALYGGFAGGESDLSERDWLNNLTILSGDVDGDDKAEIATSRDDIVGDNAGPVIQAGTAGEGTRVDGFTITAGTEAQGAGMAIGNGEGMAIENVNVNRHRQRAVRRQQR